MLLLAVELSMRESHPHPKKRSPISCGRLRWIGGSVSDTEIFMYMYVIIYIYLYIKGPGALGQKLCGIPSAGVPKLTQKKGAERDGKGAASGLQNGLVFETFPGGHLEKARSDFSLF